jgi:hypothetical protein
MKTGRIYDLRFMIYDLPEAKTARLTSDSGGVDRERAARAASQS